MTSTLREKLRNILDPHPAAKNSYEEEKQHSERIDRTLGFRYPGETSPTQALKFGDAETWAHLSPQIFQTPYPELYRMIEEIDPNEIVKSWADLGAAYGRFGLMLGAFRPNAKFSGIEIDEHRVLEAKRIYQENGLDPDSIYQGDCGRAPLPSAEVYLIYDFGHQQAVEAALQNLRKLAQIGPMKVIGRGRRVRDLIERNHPWLGSVHSPVHRDHYSIYRTNSDESSDEK